MKESFEVLGHLYLLLVGFGALLGTISFILLWNNTAQGEWQCTEWNEPPITSVRYEIYDDGTHGCITLPEKTCVRETWSRKVNA